MNTNKEYKLHFAGKAACHPTFHDSAALKRRRDPKMGGSVSHFGKGLYVEFDIKMRIDGMTLES